MNADLTLAVACFGSDPKWVKMLNIWLTHHRHADCALPVVVLTDMDTVLPAFEGNVTGLRFDPRMTRALLRDGQPFDIHGSLIVQAIRFLGPVVFMDSDALLMRDPTDDFRRFPQHALIGMAPDAGGRVVNVLEGAVPERNGGVLYFGDSTPYDRETLIAAYHDTFAELADAHPANPLLEQMVWSVVWHRVGQARAGDAFDIPRRFNSSHLWGMDPGVVVRHEHGNVKWMRLNGGQSRV